LHLHRLRGAGPVITGVGAVSDALRAGFERQGEAILGGDATLSRTHVRAVGDERALIDAFGRVSETATMRTMARRPDGSDQALGELKGVDAAYPLVGKVELGGGGCCRTRCGAELSSIPAAGAR
jgi:putative ABC transport system permease protein